MPKHWSVEIDDKGRVVPLDRRAKKHLGLRQGTWKVIPSPETLVILQRIDEETSQVGQDSGLGSIGTVSLTGAIQEANDVVDIINFIDGNKKTGVLVVLNGPVKKTIFFQRGDVRMAASNQPEDRLGAVLYRYGLVTQEQISSALDRSKGKKLGQQFVEDGVLTVPQLYNSIKKQIEDVFYSVLLVHHGLFYFYTIKDQTAFPVALNMSTRALLMEGVRRIDELSYFQEKIPDPNTVVQICPETPPKKLDEREADLYCLIDGHRTVGDLARESQLGLFETTKVVFQLLQLKYVNLRPQAEAVRGLQPHASAEALSAVIETFNQVYKKIANTVVAKGQGDQFVSSLRSFFATGTGYAELFHDVDVSQDGSLPGDTILANLDRVSPTTRTDYLYEALNELLFFEMFTAGQSLNPKDERQLHDRLNEIFATIDS